MKFEWEELYSKRSAYRTTHRAKVIGGWIIRDYEHDYETSTCSCMSFIPDPNHEWKID